MRLARKMAQTGTSRIHPITSHLNALSYGPFPRATQCLYRLVQMGTRIPEGPSLCHAPAWPLRSSRQGLLGGHIHQAEGPFHGGTTIKERSPSKEVHPGSATTHFQQVRESESSIGGL